ncbi:MAG: YbaB/EbfC family nucleoid-associated protein [Bacteroidales bacterium]|nr:YbaB/EbfC family nucleoid-associated protein [Bacteroidales bacterium]
MADLFSKLKDARKRIEDAKKRLNDIIVETSVENGAIKVKANANKVITSIDITQEFYDKADKEALEDMLLSAINIALEEAAQKGEIEMKEITRDMLPNFPGLV